MHSAGFHDAGATMVVETRYSGTHNGTGKRMNRRSATCGRLSNGKLMKFQQYVDTAQLQDVRGARVSVQSTPLGLSPGDSRPAVSLGPF